MRRKLRVTVIGNGKGNMTVVRLIHAIWTDVFLYVVVGVFDTGGHSGTLRELGYVALGDIRKILQVLADKRNLVTSWGKSFLRRYKNGVSKGNMLLKNAIDRLGSLPAAIEYCGGKLGVKKDRVSVLPVSLCNSDIIGFACDSPLTFRGQDLIDNSPRHHQIPTVTLAPPAYIYAGAANAIEKSDLIIIDPGSFASILANLFVTKMRDVIVAAQKRGARVGIILNATTFAHWSSFQTVDDYLDAFCAALSIDGRFIFDVVFVNTRLPSASVRRRLALNKEVPIWPSSTDLALKIKEGPYVTWTEKGPRHNRRFMEDLMAYARQNCKSQNFRK